MSRTTLPAPERALHAAGGYNEHLALIRGRDVSGVYVISNTRTGTVLYVGESHSGRLYDTITRHFRRWRVNPALDATWRRRGGQTFNRRFVSVAYVVTEPDQAVPTQDYLIAELEPRDNGRAVVPV